MTNEVSGIVLLDTHVVSGSPIVTRNVVDFKAFGVPLLNPFRGWRSALAVESATLFPRGAVRR